MNKILIIALMFLGLGASAQKLGGIFQVEKTDTTFNQRLKPGQLILNKESGILYRLDSLIGSGGSVDSLLTRPGYLVQVFPDTSFYKADSVAAGAVTATYVSADSLDVQAITATYLDADSVNVTDGVFSSIYATYFDLKYSIDSIPVIDSMATIPAGIQYYLVKMAATTKDDSICLDNIAIGEVITIKRLDDSDGTLYLYSNDAKIDGADAFQIECKKSIAVGILRRNEIEFVITSKYIKSE